MILALDYGEKRIGVAISDESETFAKPLDLIPNKSEVKKIFAKDFPKGTSQQEITDARRAAKRESKVEFRKVCNRLLYLINCYYPDTIVFGMPTVVDQDSGEIKHGAQALKVQQFIKKFETFLKQNKIVCAIETFDESLTSRIAEQQLREMGHGSKSIKELIDSQSAKIILEDFLAHRKSQPVQ